MKVKVKELKDAIADLDDDVELTVRQVQSFVIEPKESVDNED